MAAVTVPADSSEDLATTERARPHGDGQGDGSVEALLGRTSAQLDEARAGVALAAQLRARLLGEIERLEQRLRDSEAERFELLEKLSHRDGLLSQIFGSRSWRWTHALRRMLGRH